MLRPGTQRDRLLDFTDGEDRIDVSAYGLADFAAVEALSVQSGTRVVIELGNDDAIVINDFDLSQLDAGDVVI